MLAGTVLTEYKKCGRGNCRCARGELHGPYYYRFFREEGRLHRAYVKACDLATVKMECDERRALVAAGRQERQEERVCEQRGREDYRRLMGMLRELEETIRARR